MLVLFAKIATVLGMGLLNFHRGGGPFRINKFLKNNIGFDFGRSVFTATLILFSAVMIGSLVFPAVDFTLACVLSSGFLIWAINGWGSYFDAGTWELEYNDKPEIPWIDWVLFLIYGPKWIPSTSDKQPRDKVSWDIKKHGLPFPFTFGFLPPDLIKSPTGDIRPFKWRRKRDMTGMFLRHMHIMPLVACGSWIKGSALLLLMGPIFAFCVMLGSMFVWSEVGNRLINKIPNLFVNNPYWHFNLRGNNIAIHEIIVGILLGLLFLTLFA